MGKAMLSKSLIPFPAYGWGYVPSDGRSNGDLLQKELCPHTTPPGTAAISVLDPLAGHCGSTPLPETPKHSQASLGQSLVGSLLLSSGSWCTRFCCALQESISHSYVSSGSCMVGLMATSSKRAYSIPKSAAPRAPVPLAVHC